MAHNNNTDAFRYIVRVTFPDHPTADRFVAWLHNGHIAEVLAGGAARADVFRADGDTITIEIDYRFPSRQAFADYERDHAPRLREEGRRLFPPERGIRYERSTATLVATYLEPT